MLHKVICQVYIISFLYFIFLSSHCILGLTLGNEQLNKIVAMLQNVFAMCNDGNTFYVPPIDEIIAAEKHKLAEEQKGLENQLVLEKKKKEDALVFMASQPENSNALYFKQIEDTRKKIEHERSNAQMVPFQ